MILVVEDKHYDILLVRRAFAWAKVKVPLHVVTDGDLAVQYLSGAEPYEDRQRYPPPALVLLDLHLPRRSGHEVLAWIRESPECAGVSFTIAVVSTSTEVRDRELALGLGAHQYLVKPLSGEIVVGLLREAGLAELMDD
jgi:CheY-like chemotaxis protein